MHGQSELVHARDDIVSKIRVEITHSQRYSNSVQAVRAV